MRAQLLTFNVFKFYSVVSSRAKFADESFMLNKQRKAQSLFLIDDFSGKEDS